MYFRCTDLLQGVFLTNQSVQIKKIYFDLSFSLFGACGGAGGAVTSCLKLHEVFTQIIFHFCQRCILVSLQF